MLDRRRTPIAETHCRVGRLAELIGQTRPSYEQVRVLVHEHRRNAVRPSAGRILLEVATSPTPKLTLNRLLEE